MPPALAPVSPERPWSPPAPAPSPQAVAPPELTAASSRFVLFPARAFLAFGWLRAAAEKAISPDWWSGAELEAFLAEQSTHMLAFMDPLTDSLVRPLPQLTALVVMVVQLVLGAALLTGRRLGGALLAACGLNTIFVLLGAVDPSAFYLVLQLTLLLALAAQHGWFTTSRRLSVIAGSAAAMVLLAPFVRTIHPAEVIDDPAIMLVTLLVLLAATQVFALFDGRFRSQSRRLSSST
ncbi:MAG: hypothetical protein AAF567_25475 [Actinomycetota bacterium]